MRFSELVLKSRLWLWDIRDKDGVIIDDASSDGIRWTSTHVQDFCKDAITEMVRLFTAMKLDAYLDKAAFFRVVSGLKINKGTGLLTDITNEPFSSILRIQTTDLQKIYSPENQDNFFANRYFTSPLSDSTQPIDDGTFTIFWDKDTKTKQVWTLPLLADDIDNVQAVMKIPYTDILTLTASEQVPIIDSEDLLKLYIMRNARWTEHNTVMVKDLNDQIQQKLAELGVGIPRTTS